MCPRFSLNQCRNARLLPLFRTRFTCRTRCHLQLRQSSVLRFDLSSRSAVLVLQVCFPNQQPLANSAAKRGCYCAENQPDGSGACADSSAFCSPLPDFSLLLGLLSLRRSLVRALCCSRL